MSPTYDGFECVGKTGFIIVQVAGEGGVAGGEDGGDDGERNGGDGGGGGGGGGGGKGGRGDTVWEVSGETKNDKDGNVTKAEHAQFIFGADGSLTGGVNYSAGG